MPTRSTARWAFVGTFSLSLATVLVVGAQPTHAQNLSERMRAVAEQRQQAAAHDSSKASLLGALLYTDLTVDFKDRPAKEAIQFIADALGVPLVARYSSDRAGTGLDPDASITFKAEGKPALTVLEMVLEQAGGGDATTWQLREGFIEVGTKERLRVASARELRMYPVKDLLFEAPLFDNAPDFNLNSAIQQGSNGSQGGGGGGNGGGGGGFGGGGGGGFGGGGGGGGSGGGGQIFGDPGDAPEMPSEAEKAQKLVDLIIETVEPDEWIDNGGESSIKYYQGVLVVRAPDYVHRALAGYPFAARPQASQPAGGRYVTFTAPISIIQNVKFRNGTVTGAAGGAGTGTGGNGGGGGGGGGGNPAPPQTPSSPSSPSGGKGTGGGGKGGK